MYDFRPTCNVFLLSRFRGREPSTDKDKAFVKQLAQREKLWMISLTIISLLGGLALFVLDLEWQDVIANAHIKLYGLFLFDYVLMYSKTTNDEIKACMHQGTVSMLLLLAAKMGNFTTLPQLLLEAAAMFLACDYCYTTADWLRIPN